jgi:hypothetical protein
MTDTDLSYITNITSAQTLEPIPPQREVDVIARFTSDVSGSVNVSWSKTQEVVGAMRSWAFQKTHEIDTLVGVIRWQRRLLDYNAHYNAYLLDQMSDRQFEKIAHSFLYEPKDCDALDLITRISTILELTDIDFTPSEFADLFQCKADIVLKAVEQVKWSALPVSVSKKATKRRKRPR